MHLQPGQSVLTSDDIELGTIVDIEMGTDGVTTGIIIGLNHRPGHESRIPIAWIDRIEQDRVLLIVASTDFVQPLPLNLFEGESGNVFGRFPPEH